ncbi:MAG: phosphate-starvation-inducible PsiE family protein [Bacteroidales bacterium]|nr:phosphate-starvation-inducible PsiE family protein [Bacteroidales bacterium]MDD3299972.1 phosphate-starvation-inducible PsiE family protein [Bacteroidales bacterium]MDD3843452.1 phosphate-starvation-inducible PsiE family protein [Bacteroidales bacterium]MDD4617807.1 phosphate-starvation-inducible PsiE family protein [Bacteroidales bacterium]
MHTIKKFEKVVFTFLVFILVSYIVVEIIELVYQFGVSIVSGSNTEGRLLISNALLKEVLPVFFNILIAIELIDTFSVYVQKHSIKVLNILLIGLIAIGRKLIAFDFNDTDGVTNLGLAALIISLAGGYYLIKKNDFD